MIAIVDYGVGNLASVKNALDALNVKAKIEARPNELKNYSKLILPGVGAFQDAMTFLNKSGMDEAVLNFAKSGKDILGICLGMQLLFDKSEEFGTCTGLGLIPGQVVAFDKTRFDIKKYKIPHVGWNKIFNKKSKLFLGLDNPYLYFIHSFHVETEEKYTLGSSTYGYDFTSAVQKDNIYGFQPHPEKSHDNGLRILQNFAKL